MQTAKETAQQIYSELYALRGSEEWRRIHANFFRTGKGQYGEGDMMVGVTVPNTRMIAKKYSDIGLPLVKGLLQSKYHEVRLCGLLILVIKYKQTMRRNKGMDAKRLSAIEKTRKQIIDFYLSHADRANNWDLVDLSAPYLLGQYLIDKPDRTILYTLASDPLLWRRRIAMVSTMMLIRAGQFDDTLRLVRLLVSDTHDLMHKAMGWMLREVGKRDERILTDFLDEMTPQLPRITLRYAIERLTPEQRAHYMSSPKG